MALDLRDVSEGALVRELRARRTCRDCGTEYAAGWVDAGKARIRCLACEHTRRRGTLLASNDDGMTFPMYGG